MSTKAITTSGPSGTYFGHISSLTQRCLGIHRDPKGGSMGPMGPRGSSAPPLERPWAEPMDLKTWIQLS